MKRNDTTPPEVVAPNAKTKSRAKAKAKIKAEPVLELIVEPAIEPIVEPVKMKTRKPSNKQPKPESKGATTVPDIEDLVAKRMNAMGDAKELKKNEQIQALIAQAIFDLSKLIYIYGQKNLQIKAC